MPVLGDIIALSSRYKSKGESGTQSFAKEKRAKGAKKDESRFLGCASE
jgi:hypothetical protein